MTSYITAGELAKLANTTKRTIHHYDQKGILKPVKINSSKYRLYEETQVLDYQMILLLSTMGVSLDEMKNYLKKGKNLIDLFNNKKGQIKDEIEQLQFNLNNLETYLTNLKDNGTMVNPVIKTIDPFDVYYIEKVGSYSKIGTYCEELGEMFAKKGKNFTTLSVFEEQDYRPKESHIKICAFKKDNMEVKEEFKNIVKQMSFKPGKTISYKYSGRGEMLSLFWKELEKYCKLKGYKIRSTSPDYEIYWEVSPNPTKQQFEIFLPIE